jgi:hypothetical protein
MSAHTPGDWFAKRDGFSTVYIECRIRPGVLQEVAACGPTEAGPEQQEANARLIAAAPDMADALKVAESYLEAICFNTQNPKKRNNYADALRIIRASLEKAGMSTE